jgi:hypothetical protein
MVEADSNPGFALPPAVPFDELAHPTISAEDLVVGPYIEPPALDDPDLPRAFLLNPQPATPQPDWLEA